MPVLLLSMGIEEVYPLVKKKICWKHLRQANSFQGKTSTT